MAADIAEALFHAHQRGVVHRDVKPGNVLLASDGRTKLVDFGIAHSLAESAERLTMTGTVVGTMSAMAPEQLLGGPITPRTDLYGIGVVLYEALTGRPPYPGGSPVALAEAQRAGPPPLDGIDPTLAGIVAACLAVEPENRPLHAGALAVALRSWLAGDAVPAIAMAPTGTHLAAVDTGAVTTVAPAPVAAPLARTDAAAGPPRARSRRGLLLGVAALLGTAVIAVALASMTNPGLADESPSATPSAPPASASTPVPTGVALPRLGAAACRRLRGGVRREPIRPCRRHEQEGGEAAIEPQIEACREGD